MAHPLPTAARKVRVLVVDDSAFMRHTIARLLAALPDVEVIGMASDGVEGVRLALELRPDVVTMDVEMPRLDGVSAVREIMQTVPTPIVMLSTLTAKGAETAIRALEAGAVECIAKPSGSSHDLLNVSGAIETAIRRAAESRVQRQRPAAVPAPPVRPGANQPTAVASHLVLIGCSTGGPPALGEVVPRLPADLQAGVLVVQHMPAGFTAALAKRLDQLSAMPVSEAATGDQILTGRVLVAPGNFHLEIGSDKRVHLQQEPPLHGVRPAIDISLRSASRVFGARLTVAIMTGMGRDGAEGAAEAERAGASVVVQDEASCIVYGMPRVARELTAHPFEAPLNRLAEAITRRAQR
jgi:two-component system chemotaxis response regulator CheB